MDAYSTKEIAEIFRNALLISLINVEDVIRYIDAYILENERPDLIMMEVSLYGNEGINGTISRLERVKGEFNELKVIKTILGLCYIRFLNNAAIKDITYKLYSYSLNLNEDVIDRNL